MGHTKKNTEHDLELSYYQVHRLPRRGREGKEEERVAIMPASGAGKDATKCFHGKFKTWQRKERPPSVKLNTKEKEDTAPKKLEVTELCFIYTSRRDITPLGGTKNEGIMRRLAETGIVGEKDVLHGECSNKREIKKNR